MDEKIVPAYMYRSQYIVKKSREVIFTIYVLLISTEVDCKMLLPGTSVQLPMANRILNHHVQM